MTVVRKQPGCQVKPATTMATTGTVLCLRTLYVFVACCTLLSSVGNSCCANPCPVEVKANHSNHCECNILSEIFCYKLDAIPKFIQDGNEYAAIYMDNQDIKELLQTVFFELKVRKIVLNYNPIEDKISVNTFTGLESILEELHLGQCGIRTLPDKMVVAMNQLKVLHLWGNHIKVLPDKFFASTNNLQELSLWGNEISSLNKHTFAGLWNLKKLDLDRNKITTLEKNIFRHFGNLEALHLGENSINVLNSGTFTYMSSLKLLNFDNNGLAFLYDLPFSGLKNLKVLSLQNNKLDYLPDDMFADMKNLTILWLQHNELEFMWAKHFDNLKKLQELHLSHNMLSKLPDRLLRSCGSLAHLFVDHNNIQTVKKCSLPRKIRLKTLSLIGNPISCDCRLSWILELQRKSVSVWGNCLHTPLNTVTSIMDKENYEEGQCKEKSEDCSRQ